MVGKKPNCLNMYCWVSPPGGAQIRHRWMLATLPLCCHFCGCSIFADLPKRWTENCLPEDDREDQTSFEDWKSLQKETRCFLRRLYGSLKQYRPQRRRGNSSWGDLCLGFATLVQLLHRNTEEAYRRKLRVEAETWPSVWVSLAASTTLHVNSQQSGLGCLLAST